MRVLLLILKYAIDGNLIAISAIYCYLMASCCPGMLALLLRLASCVGASNAVVLAGSAGSAPRALLSKGRAFVDPATGVAVQLRGADVVMKGAPWIPLTNVVQ